MNAALDRVETYLYRLWAPKPRLTVSEWADGYRILAPESSAEPGPWVTARTPYLKDPMDAFTDRRIEKMVLMASAQSGKTECGLNCLGRLIHLDPAAVLWISATLETARATSKDRIGPMLRLSPELARRTVPVRGRKGSATILHRTFDEGHLTIAGSNAPASLASRPIRYLFLDEVDLYPRAVGVQGDPIAQAEERTKTFPRIKKILLASTPSIQGDSPIADWYAKSDMRRYWLPCPRCGGSFVPTWGNPSKGHWGSVRWEGDDPASAYVQCPLCGGRIEDRERAAMVNAGEWRPERPLQGIAGWHLWEFYAPWRSLADFVKQYQNAAGAIESRKVFANAVEGRPWDPPARVLLPAPLMERCEPYPAGHLPAGVRLLVASIDVQDDRLEGLVLGFGSGEESWVIDRMSLDDWTDVAALLSETWQLAGGGAVRITRMLIDAGGHRADQVYAFCREHAHRGVFAIRGSTRPLHGPIISAPKLHKVAGGQVRLYQVDTHQVKILLYARLAQGDPGPETVHFPVGLWPQFFEEVTAERLEQTRDQFGRERNVWVLPSNRANESLDLMVYAIAALHSVAPRPDQRRALLG